MKKKILLAIMLLATFFMCISLILNNNNTYSIYRETLNTKVYLSVISSGDQIKVEFDANGGEAVPDTYREYNQAIGVLPVTEQTGYNFIGWYTERDGGTKVHPSDVITAPVTYYAHWAKLVCKKAASNTLHQETCDTNGGCTKLTGEFAYELGDPITYGTPAGTGIPVTGNAYDCDVDNNGVFDPVHERFYYIRANVGDDYQNAVLVHYTSFDAAGQMDSSSSRGSYQFEAGKAYLPDSTTWSNPALISFDTKVSRYINHTDIEEACGEPIIYNNVNYLGRCQYLLENSRFQAKASGRAGIWVDKIPGSDTLYRIQSESMSIQVPDKVTSENTVRPVIEIPFNTIDGFKERESFNVTFDSVGGTHVPSEARYDGEEIGTLPTTTKDGLTFGGWYTDTTYQTEVTSSTVITSTTTFYAKWIKPLDDLKYLFYIPGSCTFGGSSTVNITSSTNDCISIVNPTDTAIDYTATANKYINTGVKLYITENKSKDYEIGFTLVNYDSSIQMRQATIMNTKLESTGYPGLVFRRFDETDKLDLSSRTTSSANTQLQIPSDGVEDVKIYRIYNEETEVQEIFYSINNGEKIKANDLSQNNPTFNTDVWFGATPKDANANTAQRYFKGTLSNMYIKIKDNSITKNTVTFNAHGGESDYAEKEVQQGATVGDLPTATKPGYVFDGWYTAETNGTKITTNTVVTADVTYHAHWKEKFIVSFDGNAEDATVSQASFEVVDGESLGSENIPTATREGYEFVGWFTDPENGTQIDGTEIITQQTEYYAYWSSSSCEDCTITYSLSSDNFDTWTKSNVANYSVDYDTTTKMSTVTVSGETGDWETFNIALATVAGKEYTFTFDYQNPYSYHEYSNYGGIGVQALNTYPENSHNTSSELARINLPSAVNAETVSKTLTFTATGTTTYIVFNFGMAADDYDTTVLLGNFNLTETVSHGNTLGNTVTPLSKSGYTFDGWYTQPNGGTQITSSTEVPIRDTTYYAHWSKTATYLNKSVTPTGLVYDGTAKIPTEIVKDEAKILVKDTDYTVTYANNIDVGTATATINLIGGYKESRQTTYIESSTTATYYINNATLSFDKGNCVSVVGTTPLYTKKNATKVYTGIRNTTEGTIPTASKNSYTFTGWYSDSNSGSKVLNADGTFTGSAVTNYTDATSWQTTEDQTLYARCESLEIYTVTADANGGSIAETIGWTGTGNTATKQVNHNSAYGTLPTVTKSDYTLRGWSLLPEGYTQVEYIQSSNSQYIDTGVQIFNKESHEIIIDFMPTQFYNYNQLFGSTYDANTFESWIYSDGNLNGRYNNKTYGSENTLSLNSRYVIDYIKDGSNLYKYVNDALISGGATNATTASTTATLTLFKSGSDYSRFKLYGAKLYGNGELMRDYIPCINDSTGEAGLYDLVNGQFYANEGSGDDFTVGNEYYITSESVVTTTGNHTIYAKWVPVEYTLTADATGGTIETTTGWAGSGNTATKQLNYGEAFGTLPTVSRNDYTFDGWSLLPDGYTQIEYTKSTWTQYIDTNYKVTKDTGIEVTYQFSSTTTQQRVFGVQDTSASGITFEFYINNGGTWAYASKDGAGQWNSTGITADTNKHTLKFNVDKGYYFISNTSMTQNAQFDQVPTLSSSNLNLYLFAENDGGNLYRLSAPKIYEFKIYENKNLVRYMIPAIQDSTGKVGLYDIIDDIFYGNAATTGNDFTAGNTTYVTSATTLTEKMDYTIYAKWSSNATTYNITYAMNNGINNSNNPSTYTNISSDITLSNPTKTLTFKGNYNATSGANAANGDVTIGTSTTQAQTFAGWTGSNGNTAQTTVTIPTGSTGDRSYEAHWTAVAGTLPTVTRIGYVCGWSTSSSGTTIEYESGGTYPTSAITEDMAATVNLYAVCNQADYVAMIGNTGYDTVQEAINAVPENGSTPTTIVVLKDLTNQVATGNTPFAYIAGGRNIYMDLQGHTISVLGTNNPKTVHIYNGYLELTNGTITTAATQGTIEISSTATFRIHDATIANTSAKAQAIFNNGGTVYIEEGSVITNKTTASGNNRRAAVHNYGTGGVIYITGGTITSTNFAGVYNERGSLTIGTQGGGVSTTSPTIQGKTYGVTAVATYKFYDGILKGETGAVAVATSAGGYAPPSTETIDTGETKISEYEANTTKVNDVDGNYKVLYLQSNTSDYTIILNPNGGSIGNISNTITVTPGSEVGSLPIPTKGIYTFDGWFDEDTDEEVDDKTIPTKSTTYYAKWIYQANPNVVEFRTTPDAQKVYYQNIDTWKTSASNFPSWNSNNKESNNFALDATENTVMKNNFDNNNCMCADNQCTSSGTVHCDKPKGYNTGTGEQVNVYTYNTSTSTKETLVTYAKGDNGIIYNLIPNKVYYWELDSDITVHGLVKFIGERRILDAGDVLNARDLGGLPVDTDNDGTIDGHLKYGKLIRGIKLNSASSVTELTNLGLTKEIDLRGESDTNKLPNYQRVEAQNYYIKHNSTNTTEQQYYAMTRAAVKQIMLDITNSNNPQNIYFHCRIGTDRTGTVAYILEGLLGVPEEDRIEDYELSFFYGLIRIHRYHNEKPGSSIGTGKERFVYMHEFMPTNDKIYEWYMAGTTEEERQNDINLINAFRTAMIE